MEEKTVKIYVRERQKVGEGVESPKYRIVAVTGGEIQIEATHFRKFEIEEIAKDVKAEVVFMKSEPRAPITGGSSMFTAMSLNGSAILMANMSVDGKQSRFVFLRICEFIGAVAGTVVPGSAVPPAGAKPHRIIEVPALACGCCGKFHK